MFTRLLSRIFLVFVLTGFGVVSAQDAPTLDYEQALECVQTQIPAERYSTNEYLPQEGAAAPVYEGELQHIKVGMPWVLNDEEAAFYNAIENGYYAQVGLEVELVPGGPGVDHLQTLAAGAVDIAVVPGGGVIPVARVSPTPINATAVGTILKQGQYSYITTNPDLLGRDLTPADLVGRIIATQPNGEFYTYALFGQNGIPMNSAEFLISQDFMPTVLMVDPPQADFYTGWISNQPRALDAAGIAWNALRYSEYGYNEYTDVVAVREETLTTDEGRDLVSRFMWGTYQGLTFLLENPEESAEIAVEYSIDADLTVEQATWRFEIQERYSLIRGTDDLGLMAMDPAAWDQAMATLLQYGQLELTCP